MSRGVGWLQAKVAADGVTFGQADSIATPMQNSSETAHALRRLATVPSTLTDVIAAQSDDNTEYLARKVISQVPIGHAVSELISMLVARQNADGGFGGASEYASNALDTSWAMLALSAAGNADSNAFAKAANYLVASQHTGGSYGMSRDVPDTYITALAAMALQRSGSRTVVMNALNLATAWLSSWQAADGSWGSVADTALVHLALLGSMNDSGMQAAARSYLIAQQGADGSWSGDPYLTALALRALAEQASPLPTKGNVAMQVIDASSGQPIGGASAVLQGSTIAPSLSDATGKITFQQIPAAGYTVAVSAAGYSTQTAAFTLSAGNTVDLGVFKLAVVPSSGIVKGVVRDSASGAPLRDALVTVTGISSATTSTAADGSYAVSGLAPGALNIVISKSGYDSVAAAGVLPAGSVLVFSPSMVAQTGQPGDPADPPNPLPGALTGLAVDSASGMAVGGVAVSLVGTGMATESGTNGRFAIAGIPAGTYPVRLSKSGYAGRTLAAVLVAANSTTDIQAVPLNRELSSVTLHGTVTDIRSGKPIAMASVTVAGTDLVAKTDANGNYRLEGLASGDATVRFAASGYASETVQASFPTVNAYRLDKTLALDSGSNPVFSMLATDRSSYGAHMPVTIDMAVENKSDEPVANAVIDLTVFGPNSQVVNQQQVMYVDSNGVAQNLFTFAANGTTSVSAKWATLSYAPGQYQVKARIFLENVASGARTVLAERTALFVIEPGQNVLRLAVTPLPAFTTFDAEEQISFRVEASNRSNLPVSTTFKYAFKTPDGTVLKEDEGTISLQPNDVLGSVVLGPFPYRFAAAGIYPVALTSTGGVTPEVLADGEIQVAPGIRVEAVQQVNPTTVTPDGDKRIRIQLQLKGVVQK